MNKLERIVKASGKDESYIKAIYDKRECLEAVKQNGYALRYVKEQTLEICLEAVKQDGDALQYVKEQTLEICLEAVKQDGCALQYVDKREFQDDVNEYTMSDLQDLLGIDNLKIIK
jgi:hypothetical protein